MKKAGIIPYLKIDGEIHMMFMTSSNPDFGGPFPSIAKGLIDAGESPLQAAVREGHEELGLKESNMAGPIKLVWSGIVKGQEATYPLTVFAVEVANQIDFDEPHYETGKIHWFTMAEFARRGRESHQIISKMVHSKLL